MNLKAGCINLDCQWFLSGSVSGEKVCIPAEIPGNVYLDLQNANLIPDPFACPKEVAWVADKEWIYFTALSIAEEDLKAEKIILRFECLDTFAEICLNGNTVGQAENSFIPYEFDVRQYLKVGNNLLCVKFFSTTQIPNQREKEFGKLRGFYGTSRLWGRKGGCFSGWSWCPKLLAGGITKPVQLIFFNHARILNTHSKTEMVTSGCAEIKNEVEVESTKEQTVILEYSISDGEVEIRKDKQRLRLRGGINLLEFAVTIQNPKLWWPNGYGEQNLYYLEFKIKNEDSDLIDSAKSAFSIRTVKLVRGKRGGNRKSFYFLVNGVPIFIKGANWILPDVFLFRATEEKYQRLISLAKEANLNLLRVPGVGVYENDIFYDLCDKFGILVWQDFTFGCGEYPENQQFLELVKREVGLIVKRLRNHPSILLWCGNNESEYFRRPNGHLQGDVIWYNIIPEILSSLDGSRPYWPTTPLCDEDVKIRSRKPASKWRWDKIFGRFLLHIYKGYKFFFGNRQNGDAHIWDVWMWYKNYPSYLKRFAPFVSEFGWQALPHIQTLQEFCGKEKVKFLDETTSLHNKKSHGHKHWYFLKRNFSEIPQDAERLVQASQILQAEALKVAVENWRRQKFNIGGIIFWQFNDCWPAISYSVVDYYLRKKTAYEIIKKAYAPILLTVEKQKDKIIVWGVNDLLNSVIGVLRIIVINKDGKETPFNLQRVALINNSAQPLCALLPSDLKKAKAVKIILYEQGGRGRILSENVCLLRRLRDWKKIIQLLSVK